MTDAPTAAAPTADAPPAPTARDRAFEAIGALIVEAAVARTGALPRFEEIARLAHVGTALRRALGNRVADFGERPDDGGDEDGGEANAPNVGRAIYAAAPAEVLLRQMTLLMSPWVQTMTEEQRARHATAEAQELEALAHLIELDAGLPTGAKETLTTRMQGLLASMAARNGAPHEHPEVAHPDDVRRHRAQLGGPRGHEA